MKHGEFEYYLLSFTVTELSSLITILVIQLFGVYSQPALCE